MAEYPLPFPDRTVAGRLLAEKLLEYKGKKDTLVLALVRGGVVVGAELAKALQLPLFPYIVRKLGHPGHREYGLGAIAEGGETYLDDAAMRYAGVTWEDLEPVMEEEMRELKRRQKTYLVEARPPLQGKTVILTDDGAATGGTLFAAIADLRKAGVVKIVVALPVCPPDTAAKLRKCVDEAVILETPVPFSAVGQWYLHFPQVEDEEVLTHLRFANEGQLGKE